eukprot:222988_1
MMIHFYLLLWSIMINTIHSELEAYTGKEPLHSSSPLFIIKLTQDSTTLYPKVYYGQVNNSRYNCSTAGLWLPVGWYDRSISWIEFGQLSIDTVTVEISIKTGEPLFNSTVRILPVSYNIIPVVNTNNYSSISFKVTGNYKTISVEYGEYLVGNKQSNFMNSLLIFVGNISNKNINKSASNVIYFAPGVHNITNQSADGILNVNQSINIIYIDRGAFVYGKINDTNNSNGRLHIIGYGILIGSYFDYCFRWNDSVSGFSMIDSARAVTIHGLTVYDPSWFMIQNELAPNSIIKSFKGMAWYYNNDGPGVSSNGIIENSFCRTADDHYKFETGHNILLRNNVVWNSFNGNSHQMGWFGYGCVNCTVTDIDIIHAEWRNDGYYGNGVIGLAGDNNTNIDVFYHDIVFKNIRIDTPVGRVIGINIIDVDNGTKHVFDGLVLKNVTLRTKLGWTIDDLHNSSQPGQQLLSVTNCNGECEINNIHFENIFIDGEKIMNDDGWNLKRSGQIISNVTYS